MRTVRGMARPITLPSGAREALLSGALSGLSTHEIRRYVTTHSLGRVSTEQIERLAIEAEALDRRRTHEREHGCR